MLSDLRYRLRTIVRRGAKERELTAELQIHYEREVAKLVARGTAPADARRQARLAMGGIEQVKEETRGAWGVTFIESLGRDIAYGFRMLGRNPGFAAAVALSLALGVGANTAVFALLNAALLKPLPYPDVDRIVAIRTDQSRFLSVPGFVELAGTSSVDHLSAFETLTFVLGDGQPEQIEGQLVSVEFGALVGLNGPLRPAIGRPFAPDEFEAGHERVALLSHGLWTRRYGAATDVVGRVILIDAAPVTIVGVLPSQFDFFATSDLLMPLVTNGPRLNDRFYRSLEVVGRLRPGATGERTATEIASALTVDPGEDRRSVRLEFVRDLLVQDFKRTLLTTWGVAALVLLISICNVANLLSARTVSRAHELAVRRALGAGRGRVVQQLVVEALVLASIGGVAGLVLGIAGRNLLSAATAQHFLGAEATAMDWRVVAFATAISVGAGLFCGVVPALRGGADDRRNPLERSGSSGAVRDLARGSRRGVSMGLAVAEVGLTLVLLIGASLLVKSMMQLGRFDPGYSTAATTIGVDLPETTYSDDPAVARFVARFGESLRALPAVTAVGATSSLPLAENAFRFQSFAIEGGPTGPLGAPERLPLGFKPPPPPPGPPAGVRMPQLRFFQAFSAQVGPGLFKAMGIPVLSGRDFAELDTSTSDQVAIVNRAFAERYWADGAAVGKRVRMTPVDPWITVVGVVGNIRRFARDDEIRSELYRPFTQQGDRRRGDRRMVPNNAHTFVTRVSFVVRTPEAPDIVRRSSQAALASIDPGLPIAAVSTLQGDLDKAVAPRRVLLRLFGVFAGMALVLAALGVYGVIAYLTRRRTREMAVRLALGASPRAVEGLVLRQGVAVAAIGVAGGVVLSLGLSRFLQPYLYDVQPFDVWIYGGVASVLALVVLLASYVPAHQAAHLEPVRILKQD